MKIVKGFPPNYSDIIAAIPAVKMKSGIIFTYGDTVYCPAGNTNLPDHLIAHEQKHIDEQKSMGPEQWWYRYLVSASYRLEQELIAYRAQYKVLQQNHSRVERKLVLSHIAKDLSGAMYGKVIDGKKAKLLITGEAEL